MKLVCVIDGADLLFGGELIGVCTTGGEIID